MTIRTDLIPTGRRNRPGTACSCQAITIHETDNEACGADSAAHARYLKGDTAAALPVSWHYTVDEHEVVQHLPDREQGYHTGKAIGNQTSIGIEICVNADGDFERALQNAVQLVRILMERHGIPSGWVLQHFHWNMKNCPRRLRRAGWEEFKQAIELEEEAMERYHRLQELPDWGRPTVQRLLQAGLLLGDGEGMNLSMDMLRLLVINDRAGLYGDGTE